MRAVADLLARGLSGDDGDLRAVVEMAVEELRSLSCARADVVLIVADVLAREDGPFNVCVASAIKSGKSTLVCALARALVSAGRVDRVVVFTADVVTAKEAFADVCATTLVGAYSEDAIAGLVARLEERREAVGVPKRTLLVLDDVVGEGVERSKSVLKLFTRGRHLGVFVCLSSQQANCALSPTFKANSRFIFFSQLTGTGMKRLCEDMVLRPPMKPSAFEAWVSAHCVDYAFGLYDAHAKALSVVRAGVFACPTSPTSPDDDSEL